MNKPKFRFIRLVIVFALTFGWYVNDALAASNTYYVGPTGKDSSPGTNAAPFKTFAKAVSVLQAGDTLQVLAGTYNETLALSKSGTESAPIVVVGNNAVLNMQGSSPRGIDANGSHLHISGFEVTGGTEYGIYINGRNIVVENNVLHDNVTKNGVNTCGISTSWGSALKVKDGTESITIRGNTIHDNCGEGIAVTRGTSVSVENNTVYDNFSVNIYVDNSPFVTVQNNISYCTGTHLRDGKRPSGIALGEESYAGWGAQLHDINISGNTISNCRYGISVYESSVGGTLKNVTISNNNIPSGTKRSISLQTLSNQNVLVANNHIFNSVYVLQPIGVTLKGNILPPEADDGGDVFIGTYQQGKFTSSTETQFLSYQNILDGPVKIIGIDSQPFFTSQLVTSGDSYNELMGLALNQFTTEYWFPYYDHGFPLVAGSNMRTWILIGNPSSSQTAEVEVYIGGNLQGSYSIVPGSRVTPRWIGLQNGPVQVVSTNSVNIFASERVFTSDTNAFNESLGYPANQFTTEYWFPWYDSVSMDTSILVGNTSAIQSAIVDVYIGSDKKGTYEIPPNTTVFQQYDGIVDGPVRVLSTNGVDIVTSENTVSGPGDSFSDTLGYSFDQFTTEYWFPYYDHGYPYIPGSNMRMWILIGNPGSTEIANVDVYIDGILRGTFQVPPGSRVTPRWIGLQGGPVRVVSDNPIFTSERVFTVPNSVFNELLGYPLNQIVDEYWFPWFDSVNMDNYLLVVKP